MLARYSSSIAVGAAITAVLIYLMQFMIQARAAPLAPAKRIVLPVPAYSFDPPMPRTPRDPLPRPQAASTAPSSPGLQDPSVDIPAMTTTPVAPPVPRHGTRGLLERMGSDAWPGSGDLVVLAQVQPLYPQAAEVRGLEGRVVVEFTVGADGTVRDLRIVESSHRIFERAALSAAAKFRYRPRVVDGVPIAVPGVRTEFAFRLEN